MQQSFLMGCWPRTSLFSMEAHSNWQDTLEMTLEVELARHPFALSLSSPSYSPSPHRMSFTQRFQYCAIIQMLWGEEMDGQYATWTRMRKTNIFYACIPPIPQGIREAFVGQKDLTVVQGFL